MTKQEFLERFDKVSARQLDRWLEKGWIRGARIAEDGSVYIPTGAKPPYARRSTKCKGGTAMYVSLATGIGRGLDVFAALYDMDEACFDAYMQALISMGYVTTYETEGITYYHPLPKCADFKDLAPSKAARVMRSSAQALSPALEAVVRGATTALVASGTVPAA